MPSILFLITWWNRIGFTGVNTNNPNQHFFSGTLFTMEWYEMNNQLTSSSNLFKKKNANVRINIINMNIYHHHKLFSYYLSTAVILRTKNN